MSEEKKAIPEKFQDLVGSIEKLSVIDLADLVKVLEDRFGVTAAAAAPAMAAAAAAPAAEEKTSFDVELTSSGANKIAVIKVIRELTQIGLKEAKDMADGAPKIVKEGVAKAEAEAMKKKFEEAGGQVTLK
ncbi:MAG: 50S ribosomal protein L7/L12 [Patescibacteria group bacterium]